MDEVDASIICQGERNGPDPHYATIEKEIEGGGGGVHRRCGALGSEEQTKLSGLKSRNKGRTRTQEKKIARRH